jgi:hypothetical protein
MSLRFRPATAALGLLAAALVLALPGGAFAKSNQAGQADTPVELPDPEAPLRQFEVTPASSEVKVDGILDEEVWRSATVIDLPYEWFPGDNVTPKAKTDSLVTFDDEHLYVAFRAWDPTPGAIRAHLMDRDVIGPFVQDDHVGINLDTFNDERRAYQFRINPHGVQVDAVFSEMDGLEDFSWDAIWSSAGRIDEQGYTVEIAIPFKQLRFPRTPGPQTWGFEAFRNYPRNVRYRMSSRYTDKGKECLLCQENKVSGFQGIAPGRNLELTPTLTSQREDAGDGGALTQGEAETEPGITARWGITPNVSLNATVNPDFSQVEADAAQLAINTRFALFYPEKRPFFLEGADLYTTPLEAVFTRTVAEPSWGMKLNAKEGRHAVGVFLAEDDRTNLILPENQGSRLASLDQSVTNGVVRYRHDLGTRSTLGVLYTGREGDDYHNRVGGVDGFFRVTTSDTVRVQYLTSQTLYPDSFQEDHGLEELDLSGDAFKIQYDHFAQNWKAFARYTDLDPRFRADSGFIPRVDIKTAEAQFERIYRGTGDSWYAQMSVGARGLRTDDHGGRQTDENVELFGTLWGPMQSYFEVDIASRKELAGTELFSLQQQRFYFRIAPSGDVRLGLDVRLGDEIDYNHSRLGEITLLSPMVQLRLGRRVNLQLSYLLQKLEIEQGELFTAELPQMELVYQFNVRTFVRAIVQYTDIERNTALYGGKPEEQDLFGQFLFSYKLNPQTVLFVGYTDSRAGEQNVSLEQTNRTFFMKLGYALLF